MSEFATYLKLKAAGIEPRGLYLKARENGLNGIAATRMLREVFGFTLMEAKSEMIEADKDGISLSEYQKSLLPSLRETFNEQ